MPYNPQAPEENLDPDFPYNNQIYSSNRYKDPNGTKYEISHMWTRGGGRIMRRTLKKDGTWTNWYYDKCNYDPSNNP